MYKCKWFEISELVPPELMTLPEDYLWKLFDENLLKVIDRLRDNLKVSITINNWKSNGQYRLSGFRPKNCAIGAPNSCHKTGKACDMKFNGISIYTAYDHIINNQHLYPEIKRIEDPNVTKIWLHIDTKVTNSNKIYVFKP